MKTDNLSNFHYSMHRIINALNSAVDHTISSIYLDNAASIVLFVFEIESGVTI